MAEDNIKIRDENADNNVRTTKVTKGINRKVQTAKFEGIEICSHVEEIIEWKTLAERQQKLDAVSHHMTEDFKRTFDTAMVELGLDQVSVFGALDSGPRSDDNKVDVKRINENLFDSIQ